MPTYNMKHLPTEEVHVMSLTLAEREELLKDPEWQQELAIPGFVTMPGGTLSRTSGDFRDLLKVIKKGSGKNSTIKV